MDFEASGQYSDLHVLISFTVGFIVGAIVTTVVAMRTLNRLIKEQNGL